MSCESSCEGVVDMEAAYDILAETVKKQEEIIAQLEQEVIELGQLEIFPVETSEEDKLRVANEKLRYRINILKVALDKELAVKGPPPTPTSLAPTPTMPPTSLAPAPTPTMPPKKPCYLCQEPTTDSCPECGLPSCPPHLSSHLMDKTCLPFTVMYKEGVGRYVVASRDIKASQIILRDTPAVLGPNYETEAVCLECLSRADGSVLCHLCNLPLCNEKCRDGPRHRAECQVFSKLEKKVSVARFGQGTIAYEYGCITVLRLLSLRDEDPATWARVQFLMDHDEERRKEKEYWQMFQKNVVDYLRIKVGLADTYSEEEIHRAIGILRTNAFQIDHPYLHAQGTSGKAIYPTFSFLSHSCIANARYSVMPDDKLTLRAQVDIKEGEEITIQYISFLFGNSRRRGEISSCWMFECRCPRCLDTTELGSFLSAALCSSCKGPVLPADNSIECEVWKCRECGQKMEGDKVLEIVKELEDEMMNTMEHECGKYKALDEKFSTLLHPNHYQLQILKRHLAGSFRGNMTLAEVELRKNLLEGFIKVFQMADPGLTKWRGKMLYQVCKTKMFLADIKHSKEETSKQEFLAEMAESIAGLEDVVRCLQYEPDNSMEFRISKLAESSLSQAKEFLSMMSAAEKL